MLDNRKSLADSDVLTSHNPRRIAQTDIQCKNTRHTGTVQTLGKKYTEFITSNSGRVVTVVSISSTNWEVLVKTGFESWWQCRWYT